MKSTFTKCSIIADKMWNSRYYPAVLLMLAGLGHVTKMNLPCMYLFVALCVFQLIFCDDLMSLICPLLLILLESVYYYKDYSQLIPYMWYAIIPFALAVVFNLIYYRRPFKSGRFTLPLAAVSAALLLGGVGTVSLSEYLAPVSLYYMLGLGAAMLLIYLLCASRLQNERSYKRSERLAAAIYAAGLMCVIIVAVFYIRNIDAIIKNGGVIFYKARNYIASVLLIALPMPLMFLKRSSWHLLSMALMLLAAVTIGSRSGLIFAPIVFILSVIYILSKYKKRKKLIRILLLAVLIPTVIIAVTVLPELFASRIAETGGLISKSETRVKFIIRAIEDFLSSPINGVGVGNMKNADIFPGMISGSIAFYHNIVLQVIASMGLVGAAAYAVHFFERAKLLFEKRHTELIVFALSYIGILLMSMTNPGMFCPFPEAGLFVVIFAVIEKESKTA